MDSIPKMLYSILSCEMLDWESIFYGLETSCLNMEMIYTFFLTFHILNNILLLHNTISSVHLYFFYLYSFCCVYNNILVDFRLFRLRTLVTGNGTKPTEKLQQAEEGENKGEEEKPVLENGKAEQGMVKYM